MPMTVNEYPFENMRERERERERESKFKKLVSYIEWESRSGMSLWLRISWGSYKLHFVR